MKVKVDGRSKRRFIRRIRKTHSHYAFVSRRCTSNLYVMNERMLWTEAFLLFCVAVCVLYSWMFLCWR